jgi:Cu2+-exporting ATPase
LVEVERLGRETRFAQIVALMEKASTEKPRLAELADRIAAPFLLLVLAAAGLAFWYWWQIDHTKALAVAIAVLIVTCPCALSLATPAAMLSAAGALARRGILVRRLQAFETLADVDAVVFDKTGTLTHDRLALAQTHVRAAVSPQRALAIAGSLAQGSLHPVSRAIALAAQQTQALPEPVVWSQVVESAGQGMEARDAQGCVYRLGSAAFCGVSGDSGQSTVGRVHLADAQGWMASFDLQEQVREDAGPAIAALHRVGIRTVLLSGDRESAAQWVGSSVGVQTVIANASPEEKLLQVQQMQSRGLRLAMVGDGLNDGPVLARADTSFALGQAAPLAQAQSDFVLQGGQVMDVVLTLHQAKFTMRIVRQNLVWAALYNCVSVPLALVGWMPPWLAGLGMAGSSLLVILNALRLAGDPLVPVDRSSHQPISN